MADDERPRFCPFCGEPVGSFFGHQGADDTTWCDRCQGWFRAERADDPEPTRPAGDRPE